ncbi:putative germin-like protein subfamily 1 member 12 [Hibiscus syriacus]|uniref:putative germin-like protein subfamily 1 member 12 n=1 Tax=Hibiscus syriacus TaxID=106335 RepID=UPI0019248B24|nr:putative germin-like protein subfamily 1 member 12 [Hibiscus syriacus]
MADSDSDPELQEDLIATRNAAAALFTLLTLNSKKIRIRNSGALVPLMIPGLNTLGISLVRIDYGPNMARATEILMVFEGTLYFNVGKSKVVAIAAVSGQNPGVITIANAMFGSNTSINTYVLSKAFKLDRKNGGKPAIQILMIQQKF